MILIKAILIESTAHRAGSLKLVESTDNNPKYSKFLGIMKGPAADFIEPTRNDRLYGRKLWYNVVSSDMFKEGLATLTILGELDHPEERLDTEIKNAAITLLEYEFDESAQVMICKFGILDTPYGHIVKNLLDAGVQLGISSRGQGDIEGDQVDPDTYLFIAFDVVAMPAVIKARPKMVTESYAPLNAKLITEQISRSTSVDELTTIKRVLSNLPESGNLLECIDAKLVSLSPVDGSTTVTQSLLSDLESAYSKIGALESEIATLKGECNKSSESTSPTGDPALTPIDVGNTITSSDNENDLSESTELVSAGSRLRFYKRRSEILDKSLRESHDYAKSLSNDLKICTDAKLKVAESLSVIKKSINDNLNEVKNLTHINESLESKLARANASAKTYKMKYDNLSERYSQSQLSLSSIKESYEAQLQKRASQYDDLKRVSQSTMNASAKQLTEVSTQLAKLTESVSKAKLSEAKYAKLVDQAKSEVRRITESYLSVKSRQSGLAESLVRNSLPHDYSAKDIDDSVSKLSESKVRLNSLPFDVNKSFTTPTLVESVITSSSHEDPESENTQSFLEKFSQIRSGARLTD